MEELFDFRTELEHGTDHDEAAADGLPSHHAVLNGLDDFRDFQEEVEVVGQEDAVLLRAQPLDRLHGVSDLTQELAVFGSTKALKAIPDGEAPALAGKHRFSAVGLLGNAFMWVNAGTMLNRIERVEDVLSVLVLLSFSAVGVLPLVLKWLFFRDK